MPARSTKASSQSIAVNNGVPRDIKCVGIAIGTIGEITGGGQGSSVRYTEIPDVHSPVVLVASPANGE